MKKIALLSLLLLTSLSLSACGNQTIVNQVNTPISSSNVATPIAAPESPSAVSTTPVSATVNISNFSFSPASLVIKKGTTVTWTNNDSAPHQIKSDSFSSSVLNNGGTFSFTFNDAGTFSYICSIHTSMKGEIIVQ
ncbi:MAG: cupredoxin family copper-binding protein [Candidatus Falkowbacteria bacterium]